MLSIVTIEITPFMQNARILFDGSTDQATVVDPGGDVEILLEALTALKLRVSQVFLTHAHIDHGGGVEALRKACGGAAEVPLLGHKLDRELRASISQQAVMFGLSPAEYQSVPEPERYIDDGDQVGIGSSTGKVLFTPGHAPGHVALYFERQKVHTAQWKKSRRVVSEWTELDIPVLLAGDTLFSGSIGRTDLPGGSHRTLISSIRDKILTLPDATVVMPGHGPDTTVGEERRTNPFLT